MAWLPLQYILRSMRTRCLSGSRAAVEGTGSLHCWVEGESALFLGCLWLLNVDGEGVENDLVRSVCLHNVVYMCFGAIFPQPRSSCVP